MCNRASRLVDRLSLYSGAAGLKAWSVVSYFLRYFSSTSTEQISPDSAGLIRRDAPASKNGPLPTNLRVVLSFWSSSEYAPHIWPGKGPHTASFRKIGMVLVMRAATRNTGMPCSGANYEVCAIAIRAINGWQNSFGRNCSLSIREGYVSSLLLGA